MYYVLIQGTHMEKGRVYKTETEQDEQGKTRIKSQPVVESKRDLVVAFGPEKFREVSKDEALRLGFKELDVAGGQENSSPVPATATESEVAKAVKKGAVAIAEPPGVDVTGKFEELSEWPKITAYFKRGKGYFVVDGSNIVTEEPLKRDEVVKWIQAYMEG